MDISFVQTDFLIETDIGPARFHPFLFHSIADFSERISKLSIFDGCCHKHKHSVKVYFQAMMKFANAFLLNNSQS